MFNRCPKNSFKTLDRNLIDWQGQLNRDLAAEDKFCTFQHVINDWGQDGNGKDYNGRPTDIRRSLVFALTKEESDMLSTERRRSGSNPCCCWLELGCWYDSRNGLFTLGELGQPNQNFGLFDC